MSCRVISGGKSHVILNHVVSSVVVSLMSCCVMSSRMTSCYVKSWGILSWAGAPRARGEFPSIQSLLFPAIEWVTRTIPMTSTGHDSWSHPDISGKKLWHQHLYTIWPHFDRHCRNIININLPNNMSPLNCLGNRRVWRKLAQPWIR